MTTKIEYGLGSPLKISKHVFDQDAKYFISLTTLTLEWLPDQYRDLYACKFKE